MIVYPYELRSQELHRYVTPRETDYYNATRPWPARGSAT